MMRSVMRWLVALVFCALVVAALGSFKFSQIRSAIEAQEAQPEYSEKVQATHPKEVLHGPTIKAFGVVVAPQQVTLRNELPGYITQVNYRSGAAVARGKVILQLDISEQLATLASAKARARLAELIYVRDQGLLESNAVSQEAVDRSQADLDVVKSEIAAIQSVIDRRTIRAPFDGKIGIHQFEPGQYLDANTVITTIIGQNDEKWVDFSVPQFYGELGVGDSVQLQVVRAQAATVGSGHGPYQATVIAADSVIEQGSRSRLYRAEVKDAEGQLHHNASVSVVVPVGAERPLLAVPAEAVRRGTEGSYVFILDPEADSDGYRARRTPVSIEGEQGDVFYVEGEVRPQELLATAGSFKLSDGLLAFVLEKPADAAPEAGG